MRSRHLFPLFVLPLAFGLGGCDLLGGEDPAKAAAREADGKAIGGACRHSGRALEDCYVMNPKAQKAAVYSGWRDMDAYMRENSIQPVVPDLVDPPVGAKPAAAPEPKAATEEKPAEPDAKKTATDDRKAGVKPGAAFDLPAPPRPPRFT